MERDTIDKEEQARAIALLAEEQCSCVIAKEGEFRIFRERGVKDLFRLLASDPGALEGAFVADKVVGKAAAALMALGKIKGLHAFVISQWALELLEHAGINVTYGKSVEHIINRSQTDWCPLEKRCRDLVTPEECLAAISDFMKEQ